MRNFISTTRKSRFWKNLRRFVTQVNKIKIADELSKINLNISISKFPYLTLFYLAYCIRPEIILNFRLLGYIMIFEVAFRLATREEK